MIGRTAISTAEPVFNTMFGGFGFWFFGLWIPLF
jgi:hypothetical protein